ncbi:MAG: FG-GAP-like repeat-containing protein [Blastocatellia bacterium]|nr:FG-GAP-like repeat-containing protein [Blastocatellia bacterium]
MTVVLGAGVAQQGCANAAFVAQPPLMAGGRPRPVVAADFNGDGKPDLAIGNSLSLFGGFNNYNIAVLLNQGNGGFAPASGSPQPIDEGPISLSAADFNGDGRMDLAVASEIAKTVTILLGDGAGNFAIAGTPLSYPSRPTYLLALDLNGDARMDLVVAKADDSNMNVLLGNGTGTFSEALASPISTGTRPFFIAAGDFNNDTRPDLAVANLGSLNVTILINTGNGRFSRPAGSPLGVPGRAYGLAVGDFNGDGRVDLAVKNTLPGSSLGYVTVLLNAGNGGFTAAPGPGEVPQPALVGFFGYLLSGDFDKDSKVDVVVANPDGSDVSVWYGDGTGGFRARQRINSLPNPYGVVAADFDANGFQDLAVTFESQEKLGIFLGGCGAAMNTTPTIAAAPALVRQRGSAGSVSVIAAVGDLETASGSLTVTADALPEGLSVSNFVNSNGAVSATVAANCDATVGPNAFFLTVSDASGFVSTAPMTVNVTANGLPTVGAYPGVSVSQGNSRTVAPASPPTDNGSVLALSATGSAGFTGTLSVDRATGVVSIANAGPIGSHTVTVTVMDNCGATSTQPFAVTVTPPPNGAPTIVAGPALVRQQGSPVVAATLATVSDVETLPGNLTVVPTVVPSGILLSSLVNTNGTITANVAAGCGATVGANTLILSVTDGSGATASASLTVNVAANAAPALGSYSGASISVGGGATAAPGAPPSDNGSIASLTAGTAQAFTGAVSIDPATGVVAIQNAGPAGSYTITVAAVDNCGANAAVTFPLIVNKLAATITLSASNGPYILGQPVTLTAVVAGGGGFTPTGSVTFSDGATGLGSASIDGQGRASLTATSLAAGVRSLTATYNGDANFANALSAPLSLTVVRTVANVSAANYQGAALAAEQIVAAFGTGLATATQVAVTQPLPTSLAGTTIRVRDAANVERLAPLFFVSATQINYLVPEGTAAGQALVTVLAGDGATSQAVVRVDPVAPGLFTADATGAGLAAANVLRVKIDGTLIYEPVARFDTSQNRFVAVPIDFGAASDQIFLLLYGTGFRNRSALPAVTARIGGADAEILYAGAQGSLAGLDQINLRLPRSLAGRSEVDVVVTIDGKALNVVKVGFR